MFDREPQLLQQLDREVLGLVDDDDGLPSGGVLRNQIAQECLVARGQIVGPDADPERGQDPLQQAAERFVRVGNDPVVDALRGSLQQMAYECRLAGADLAGDHGEACLTAQRVLDHAECKAMLPAHEQECRIRLQRKRTLRHAVEGLIHCRTLQLHEIGRTPSRPTPHPLERLRARDRIRSSRGIQNGSNQIVLFKQADHPLQIGALDRTVAHDQKGRVHDRQKSDRVGNRHQRRQIEYDDPVGIADS